MECLYCKGEMQRGVAPFSIDYHGCHVAWDAIPAWVCEQCGEPLFESAEVDKIQAALMALDTVTQDVENNPPRPVTA